MDGGKGREGGKLDRLGTKTPTPKRREDEKTGTLQRVTRAKCSLSSVLEMHGTHPLLHIIIVCGDESC